MAEKRLKSAIGLEISEDIMHLCQVVSTGDGLVISKVRSVTIPPKVVNNSEIIDADMLAEQITKSIEEEGFESNNIIVGIHIDKYVKNVEKRHIGKLESTRQEIESKITSFYPFKKNHNFDFGFQHQEFLEEITQEEKSQTLVPVLYAAVNSSIVNALQNLMDLAGFNLVAIDLIPLAMVRAMIYNNQEFDEPTITLVLEEKTIDLNVIDQDNIVFSRNIKLSKSKLNKDEVDIEKIAQQINLFISGYYNSNPKAQEIHKVKLFTRIGSGKPIIKEFKAVLSQYSCEEYSPTNLSYEQESSNKQAQVDSIEEYLPAIGLALKYFEKYNKTLSLIKVKKDIGPIVNKLELTFALVVFLLSIVFFFMVNIYLQGSIKSIDNQITGTRLKMKRLQTGTALLREKKLKSFQTKIRSYNQLRKPGLSKENLLKMLSTGLESDIVFNRLNVSAKKIDIAGNAYSQLSILKLYRHIKKTFKNISIKSISASKNKKEGSVVYSFGVSVTK
jgi:hypothetical protein